MIPTSGCSQANLQTGEDPIGSATTFAHLFLIHVPGPWSAVALASPAAPAGVREALALAARTGVRAHALLIDGGANPPHEGIRVVHYVKPSGYTRRFLRNEYRVATEYVADCIAALAVGGTPNATLVATDPALREMLVCTHGERDGCCGRFGEAAFKYLRARHATPKLRVWRVSHFGGHRFAPTLLDLPDGRSWGWLSTDACDAITLRSGNPRDLSGYYRGWCALPAEAQIGERDLFFAQGWGWLNAEVKAELQESTTTHRDLQLYYRHPGGAPRMREARIISVSEVIAPASCGAQPSVFVRYSCAWSTDPTPAEASS